MVECDEELQGLLERHKPFFLGWLASFTGWLRPRLDPADVLQEAFLRGRPKYRAARAELAEDGRRQFFWLCRQVRDAYSDLARHHTQQCRDVQKRQEPLPTWGEDAPASPLRGLEDLSTPSRKAERNELWERFDRVMGQLDPEDREILYLHLMAELPAPDIAQVLQVGLNCVYQRLCRAKKRFRDLFGPRDG